MNSSYLIRERVVQLFNKHLLSTVCQVHAQSWGPSSDLGSALTWILIWGTMDIKQANKDAIKRQTEQSGLKKFKGL